MYIEMDVELLSPDKEHKVGVNEYSQRKKPFVIQIPSFCFASDDAC